MEKFLKKIIWLVFAIPVAYLAIVWNGLPAIMPMHFNLKGNVDRYGSKNELLAMIAILSALNVGLYFLLRNIYRIDPRKYAFENRERLHRIGVAISIFLSAVLCLIIYGCSHGNIKFSTRLILAGVGLLFTFIGNYIYNIKPNYFAGLRLPWTLENEENWRKTHLLAGKLWFAGGLLIAILSLLFPLIMAIASFFVVMLPLIIIPCVYSYRLYKKQKALS
jgi:uncharacterized membrane protein